MKKSTAELALEALESAKNGLLWYADAHPADKNGSDVLLRRMCRVIRASSDIKAAP